MNKTSNKKAHVFVESKKTFQGNKTFGEYNDNIYAVYSYGYHFPIYAYINGDWYENTDSYSVTTSRHKTQLRPHRIDYKVDTECLTRLIREGK